MTRISLLAALFAFTLTACDSNDPVDPIDPVVIEADTVRSLAADPAERNPMTGQVADLGQYTLYSLRDGEVVLSYDDEDRSDSTSTAWDIGFQGSTIIVNGGASGPGMGAALILEEAFDAVTEVPATATLRVDGSADCPSVSTPGGTFPGAPLAVCTGSDNGWYTYVPFPGNQGGYLVPTPGRTLLVRTADGEGFAKIRFESYYQGAPATSEITFTTPGRYYTFNYALNESGRSFVATAN